MAHFETEEQPIPPLMPRARRKLFSSDRLLTTFGLLLASAAAFFPWYIFLNPEKFKLPAIRQENLTRALPDWPGRSVVTVSPSAIPNSKERQEDLSTFDTLTTATTASVNHGEDTAKPLEQPFPGKSSFRLLHVANGRAVIEDANGLYMVQVGSVLPDESRLAAIEQHDGKWVIVTSKGVVSQN
ncbi:flagellar protein [Oryzifoliimicrobium ureilyticus]|uniref:flagellar protein n=1 Tax=Oryzifoliimicrobium ureilyticus TaxID=3113724 RepID=UPI003076601E